MSIQRTIMRILITAYILLAFASWSALAAPFSIFERDSDGNGNSFTKFLIFSLFDSHFTAVRARNSNPPSASSELTQLRGRGMLPYLIGVSTNEVTHPGNDTGIVKSSTDSNTDTKPPGGCGSKSKGDDDSKDDSDGSTQQKANTTPYTPVAAIGTVVNGPPVQDKRRLRPMRRRRSNGSPSIFDRDNDSANPTGTSGDTKPVTAADIFNHFVAIGQAISAQSQRRAANRRASRGHN